MIELLISIVLLVIISSAVYFAVTGALDAWSYCRDQLSLQKVLTETMDKVVSGSVNQYGLKDSLEISAGGKSRVEFVPPWVDDTHSTASRDFVYTLNSKLKSGTAVPIAEIRMPESNQWKLVPVQLIPLEDSDTTQVKLGLEVPESSELRFIYHPDKVEYPDAVRTIYWNKRTKEVVREQGDDSESLSKNLFDVEILNVSFRYFTNTNEPLTDRDWVDEGDLQLISGIEVAIEAKLEQQTQRLVRFLNLRNAGTRTGYLNLTQGMRLPIPDSKKIKALHITNISGVANNDALELEATPRAGTPWRVRIEFERIGAGKPLISKVNVEHPPQVSVYTEYPKLTVDLGVNLLLLGSDGLFDYDDDEDVEDMVTLEGDVELRVTEMTIEGAGLFVRP